MYPDQIPLYLNGEQFFVDNINQGKFVVEAQLQILIVSLLWSGGMVMCWSSYPFSDVALLFQGCFHAKIKLFVNYFCHTKKNIYKTRRNKII